MFVLKIEITGIPWNFVVDVTYQGSAPISSFNESVLTASSIWPLLTKAKAIAL